MTENPATGEVGLEIGILGPLSLRFNDRPVELRRVKERTILAVLTLRIGQMVTCDHLARVLWEDDDASRSPSTLRVHVSRLRHALTDAGAASEEVIVTSGSAYILRLPPNRVDAWRYEELATQGRRQLAAGDPLAASSTLQQALGLWRGRVLDDLALSPASEPDVVRLEESRLSVLEERVEADLGCGRHRELVGELEHLISDNPLRERLSGQQMVALYRSGRQAEALRVYAELRIRLRDELGIRPSPALQRLEQAVLDQDASLEVPALIALPAVATPAGAVPVDDPGLLTNKHNLQEPLTSFVGRRDECSRVGSLLCQHRFVTLTGMGGVGKSRLALRVGAQSLAAQPDGVWLVELDGVTDPSGLPASLAAVLGAVATPGESMLAAVLRVLRAKCLLLILDNCEHLLAACAQLAGEILSACPDVRILATSRERLRVKGEVAFAVTPLGEGADATQLFIERAMMANPTVTEVAPAVAATICARLDFLPLAIELAAGWSRMLSPEQISRRLDDRLSLLTAKETGIPERHQSLRLLLDSSYSLLDPDEQTLLRRVSVFRGGFTIEAAEHIGGLGSEPAGVLGLLADLVDKSLVAVERRSASSARYRLLETVRDFVAGQLDEDDLSILHARHLAWYSDVAGAAGVDLAGPGQAAVLDALEADRDNFRHALDFATTEDAETGLCLAIALAQFWTVRGDKDEGRSWLELLLGRSPNCSVDLRARAECWVGRFAWAQGDRRAAQEHLTESLHLWRSSGDMQGVSETLAFFGDGWAASGELDQARICYDEALDLLSDNHDAIRLRILNGLGTLARAVGDWDRAAAAFEDCLVLPGAHEDPRARAQVLNNLAVVRLGEGDTVAAELLLGESVAIKRGLHDRAGVAVGLINLGAGAVEQGNLDAATAYYSEALVLHDELGNDRGAAYAVQGLGEVATSRGEYEQAARLLATASATRARIGVLLSPAEQAEVDEFLATARAGAGDDAFQRAWDAGLGSGHRPAVAVSRHQAG